MIKTVRWSPTSRSKTIAEFLQRPPFDPRAEKVARKVLSDIAQNGDRAVLKYAKSFDGVSLTSRQLRVTEREMKAARKEVDSNFKKAAQEAYRRIGSAKEAEQARTMAEQLSRVVPSRE